MRCKTTCAVSGLAIACAAVALAPSTESLAETASFDSRWLAFSPAQKADRIERPRSAFHNNKVYFFELPTVQTTVVVRDLRSPVSPVLDVRNDQTNGAGEPGDDLKERAPVAPVNVSPHDVKRQDKLPIGCESSFSPVTTPLMANVSGRCLS